MYILPMLCVPCQKANLVSVMNFTVVSRAAKLRNNLRALFFYNEEKLLHSSLIFFEKLILKSVKISWAELRDEKQSSE